MINDDYLITLLCTSHVHVHVGHKYIHAHADTRTMIGKVNGRKVKIKKKKRNGTKKKNYEKYEVRAHTDTRTNGYIRHCKTRTRIVVNITVYQHNDIITMMLPIEYILLGFYIFAVFYLSIIPYPPETNRATGSSRRRFYYFRSLSSRNSSYPHPVHSRSITFH